MTMPDEFDAEHQLLLFLALEKDCVALVSVINQLGSVIDSIAREWPEGVGLPDDALEQLETIDRRMDDIYARRMEWKA